MKLVCISDTHSYHRKVSVPADADVLVHAGDFSWQGELAILEDFAKWMGEQPHKHKIVILGNHDLFENRYEWLPAEAFKKHGVIFLHNSAIEIEGVVFYGTPHTKTFHDWAFMREEAALKNIWRGIPDATDVLLVHGPRMYVLDQNDMGEHCGSEQLGHRIDQMPNLQLVIHGHIHEGYGQTEHNGVRYVNAATCTGAYAPTNKPIVVEL